MNSNYWDVTRMMSVIQESVKLEFCMQIPGVYSGLRENFLLFFVINGHLGSHIVCILILFFIWLQTKCIQLDSNFIANNLRKQMGLRHFFHITQCFHL